MSISNVNPYNYNAQWGITYRQPTQSGAVEGGNSYSSYQPKEANYPTSSSALGGFTTEQLEQANQFATSGVTNPFSSSPSTGASRTSSLKGSAYEGFSVPENNGTGELIANVDDREDSIDECSWKPYFA